MNVWICVGVVPIRPAPAPVWTTVVRMPCARLALANVFAAASVDGLVMTSISSPQRSNVPGAPPRTTPALSNESRRLRCGRSHGDSICGLNLCDPPWKVTVTSTELRTRQPLLARLVLRGGYRRLPSLISRAVPRIRPSAGSAGRLPRLPVFGPVDHERPRA